MGQTKCCVSLRALVADAGPRSDSVAFHAVRMHAFMDVPGVEAVHIHRVGSSCWCKGHNQLYKYSRTVSTRCASQVVAADRGCKPHDDLLTERFRGLPFLNDCCFADQAKLFAQR